MARDITLSRDEAELLTDLLMLTDNIMARDLSSEIRDLFGMVSQERELNARGITLDGVRKKWCEAIT